MGGVPRIVLPSAVGVGAGALGHAEDQLALARLAGGQFGDGELTRGDASVEFGASSCSLELQLPDDDIPFSAESRSQPGRQRGKGSGSSRPARASAERTGAPEARGPEPREEQGD